MDVNVKALRRLNTTHNRTDVENLFLKETYPFPIDYKTYYIHF